MLLSGWVARRDHEGIYNFERRDEPHVNRVEEPPVSDAYVEACGLPILQIGMQVEIVGISREELNGKIGTIVGYYSLKDRYGITIGTTGPIAIRSANLKPIVVDITDTDGGASPSSVTSSLTKIVEKQEAWRRQVARYRATSLAKWSPVETTAGECPPLLSTVSRIGGLQGRADLNGELCVVQQFVPGRGRWQVTCKGESIAIRGSNLSALPQERVETAPPKALKPKSHAECFACEHGCVGCCVACNALAAYGETSAAIDAACCFATGGAPVKSSSPSLAHLALAALSDAGPLLWCKGCGVARYCDEAHAELAWSRGHAYSCGEPVPSAASLRRMSGARQLAVGREYATVSVPMALAFLRSCDHHVPVGPKEMELVRHAIPRIDVILDVMRTFATNAEVQMGCLEALYNLFRFMEPYEREEDSRLGYGIGSRQDARLHHAAAGGAIELCLAALFRFGFAGDHHPKSTGPNHNPPAFCVGVQRYAAGCVFSLLNGLNVEGLALQEERVQRAGAAGAVEAAVRMIRYQQEKLDDSVGPEGQRTMAAFNAIKMLKLCVSGLGAACRENARRAAEAGAIPLVTLFMRTVPEYCDHRPYCPGQIMGHVCWKALCFITLENEERQKLAVDAGVPKAAVGPTWDKVWRELYTHGSAMDVVRERMERSMFSPTSAKFEQLQKFPSMIPSFLM